MATCKDCVHYEVCKGYLIECAEHGEAEKILNPCANFKNKADFVEVKHGEWANTDEGEYMCTNCNEYFCIDIDMHPIDDCNMYYCPNCGADMRKGENNAK